MKTELDEAYIHLSEPAAALYRQLGVCPLVWFDTLTLAALVDLPAHTAEQLATDLVNVGLLDSTNCGYAMTRAQRIHARTRMEGRVEDEFLAMCLDRTFDYMLCAAAAANRLVTPSHRPLWADHLGQAHRGVPFALDEKSALDWLEVQLANFMAVVRYGIPDGRYTLVCDLVHYLWPLWLRRRYPEQRYEAQIHGLVAAVSLNDDHAYGQMLTSLAGTVRDVRPQEAYEYNLRAAAHYRTTGDALGLAQALNALGKDLLAGGELERAEMEFRQAEDLRSRLGYHRGVALSKQGRGLVALSRGDAQTAAGFLEEAFQILIREGDTYDAALTQIHHARAIAANGAVEQALFELDGASEVLRATTSLFGEATALEARGEVLSAVGRVEEATVAFTHARDIYCCVDSLSAARLQCRIDGRI